jgi:D-methionine transport system substrate-binding protein
MSNETPAPVLPERKKSKAGWIIGGIAAVAAIAIAGALILPGLLNPATADASDDEVTTVTIGVTNSSEDYWRILSDLALEENIKIELVNFTEYPLPNPALASGETDLNSFQHLDYLSNHNIATGDNLQPIGSTVIVPLPLYSLKWDSVEDIPKGAEIAIPNDPSNQGRAINVLKSAGLLTLIGDPTVPTPADIDASKSTVIVTPVEASQTVTALQSVDGAIINNNFSNDAGIDPSTALFSVDPADPLSWPYLNVFAARADDIDNPVFLKIVELWHTKAVEDAVIEASGGTAVIQDLPGDELRERLASIEEQKKAAQG